MFDSCLKWWIHFKHFDTYTGTQTVFDNELVMHSFVSIVKECGPLGSVYL